LSNEAPAADDAWTTVAILTRPRGNKGELTAVCLSSKPERFGGLRSVHLFGNGDAFEVERVWDHEGTIVFKFRGIDSISDAEKLRGAEVRVPKSQRVELEEGEYFHADLVGCEVRESVSDRLIGSVTGWEEYGGPALLEVDNGRLLIPFVKAICVDIRPEERLIRVDLPEGLESL
jgi:16S rRNA processing protein RimM